MIADASGVSVAGRTPPKHPLEIAHRFEIDFGSPRLSRWFIRALSQYDPMLECFYFPHLEKWVLYRLKHRKGCRSEDIYRLQFVLEGPNGEFREPGFWLLDYLRKCDQWRNMTREEACKKQMKDLEDGIAKRQAESDKEIHETNEDFVNDVERFSKHPCSIIKPETSNE